jgi:hypothetical protein
MTSNCHHDALLAFLIPAKMEVVVLTRWNIFSFSRSPTTFR